MGGFDPPDRINHLNHDLAWVLLEDARAHQLDQEWIPRRSGDHDLEYVVFHCPAARLDGLAKGPPNVSDVQGP